VRAGLFIFAVLTGVAGAASPARARDGDGQWRVAPAASWVAPSPVVPTERAPADESVDEYLLDDTQVRVSAKTVEYYRHLRYRPRSPAQVEGGSQLEIDFNPAFERLVIHAARVERDGHIVATLAANEIKVAQREKSLEERIYDGSLTALLFLHDVRVGDVLDYAYTVEGANPVLGGKYVTDFPIADRSFTATWRRRILMPEARSLRIKNHGADLAPVVTTGGGWRVYTWERRAVQPIEPEDGLPPWFDPEPTIEASEFGSWAEVAALFAPNYADPGAPSRVMTAQIAKLRAMAGTAEDRLLEATRFVQDEIRYLGMELNVGGHRPFAPSTVLERRFGDCKDKSVLLVTLLRALGFDAKIALVNTARRHALDDALPSPLAFNHAIVQVTVGGQSQFIDPTISYQRGPLSVRYDPEYERALILAPETGSLASIPRTRLPDADHVVHETLIVGEDDHSGDMDLETTYRGAEADRTRALYATQTRREISRNHLNYYSKENPTVTQAADLEVVDDERRNVITVRERYHVAELWKDGQLHVIASPIEDSISAPRIKLRSMPYAVEFPLDVRFEAVVQLPGSAGIDPETLDIGDDHLHFRFESRGSGRELSLRYELQSLADAVAPAKVQRFFQVQDEILEHVGYVLYARGAAHGVAASAGASWHKTPTRVVGLIALGIPALAGFVIGLRSLGRISKRRRFQKRNRLGPGEGAATAIAAASTDDLGARVEELRCSCGSRYQRGSAEPADSVSYDGRTLEIWAVECGECRERRSIFFAVRGE